MRKWQGRLQKLVDLEQSRKELDRIDIQMVELFEQRMQIVKDVAEYKLASGKPVLDRVREQEKLAAVCRLADSEFNQHGISELFTQLMSISRKLQYSLLHAEAEGIDFKPVSKLSGSPDTKVVYFGTKGSYTEQAMEEYFGTQIERFPAETFRDVMAAVKEGSADYGVLPIENTTTGGITDSYDLLVEFDNYIVAEHILKVDQALLGLPGASLDRLQTVYSHPQGLLQSRRFLEQFPQIKTVECSSTAGAAKKIVEDGDQTQAAVAGIRAAKTYGLEVLAEHINHEGSNSTRFIIISRKKIYLEGSDKVSICFTIPHESGSLYSMLSHIIYNNLNMTKIESRPLPGRNFEYRFFVDFEGNFKEAAVSNTLDGIRAEALELKLLGNYPAVFSN